jgi:hypothetical protein
MINSMTDMLSQNQKPKENEAPKDLADLQKRRDELIGILSKLDDYLAKNNKTTSDSPLYGIKLEQLESLNKQIQEAQSSELSGDPMSSGDLNSDIFESDDFKKLVDSLPGDDQIAKK